MPNEKIYIYHTNDLHSDLTYWPRIAQELREKRMIREEHGDIVLAFDIGDASDRVHPLTEATNGQAITELLNEGNFDSVTIGNNEGITNSKEELNQLYDNANFQVVVTNLFDTETGQVPKWLAPYKIIETPAGKRIGVFGLTAPLTETYKQLGWEVTNPIQQTQQFFKAHQEEADFWILLSHLGLHEDRLLSKLFPIPLILGAHSHHVLLNGEKSGASTLAGAGQFGHWLGEIVISAGHGGLGIENVRLINTEKDIQSVNDEVAMVKEYQQHGHRLLRQKKIAHLSQDYPADWLQHTSLIELVLDAVADFVGTDAAILNAGLLMGDLKKGLVTADDLHRILPHPIRLMRCEIQGKYLQKLVEEIENIDVKMINRPVKGFGFRGKVFGKLCLKGMSIVRGQLLWNNQAIDSEKIYTIATIDYFSFLPFFDILNTYSTQETLFPDFLRIVVGNYLEKKFPVKI